MPILSTPFELPAPGSGISITKEMRAVLSAIARGDSPIFVSGGAGTGKSTLLKFIRENSNPSLAVVAPTGVAALNVRGSTIHSFFRLPPSLLTEHDFKFSPSLRDTYDNLSGIVIDEISMVRADLLDAINTTLKMHRKRFDAPFGGIQVVFFGDAAQLPPVIADDALKNHFNEMYTSPFFFDAHALRFVSMRRLNLTEIFRQTDGRFIEMLNRVRNASATPGDLAEFNRRVDPRASEKASGAITLTMTNRAASDTNRLRLDRIPGEPQIFHAEIQGQVKESAYPADQVLHLKNGARVIMLQNNTPLWANGTIGTVTEMGNYNGEESIRVKMPSGEHWIRKHTWDVIKYVARSPGPGITEEIVGTFRQFPMKLAWAITVHRSQGMTFDQTIIDLTRRAFDHGQLYVALSRCRSLNGLWLTQSVRPSDLKYHERIRWFENQ